MLHAIAAFLRREGETLERAPAHEMLRVGLCLAFTGGFLDAYTYLLRGGVFAVSYTHLDVYKRQVRHDAYDTGEHIGKVGAFVFAKVRQRQFGVKRVSHGPPLPSSAW